MRKGLLTVVLPSMTLLSGLGANVVAAVAQTTIVVDGSALSQRLASDMATNGARIVTLGSAGGSAPEANLAVPLASTTVGQFAASTQISLNSGDLGSLRYFLTDLGTLGGTQSFAYAVNDLGQVVGSSWIAGDTASHSFLYSNGKMQDLYPLNSQDVQTVGPTGINDFGQIASGLTENGVYVPAILNSATGSMTMIGSLGNGGASTFGVATSINNFGSATGYSYVDNFNRHAFLFKSGSISDMGSFGGYSSGASINDWGQVVGSASDSPSGVAHAFLDVNGTMNNLDPATESYGASINDLGQVVGKFLTPDQTATHAFFYSEGSFIDIGLAGSSETDAMGINNLGQIVGTVFLADGQSAFLLEGGKFFDLNSLIPAETGWNLQWAFDANNLGQIVGYGLVNNKYRAYLLTPALSPVQCLDGGWVSFGFKNPGQCVQYVVTGK